MPKLYCTYIVLKLYSYIYDSIMKVSLALHPCMHKLNTFSSKSTKLSHVANPYLAGLHFLYLCATTQLAFINTRFLSEYT